MVSKGLFVRLEAFHNDSGLHAHLAGRIAAALRTHSEELFAAPPMIEKMEVLAAKLPVINSLSRAQVCCWTT